MREAVIDGVSVTLFADNGTQPSVSVTPCPPFASAGCTKNTVFQGGIHVPFFVAGPGVVPGSTTDALVSTTDVMATLASEGAARGLSVYVCSSDKDLRQCLSRQVKILNLRKQEELDADAYARGSDEPEIDVLVGAADTPPFLTDRRVVLARHAGLFSTADRVAPLVAYLASPAARPRARGPGRGPQLRRPGLRALNGDRPLPPLAAVDQRSIWRRFPRATFTSSSWASERGGFSTRWIREGSAFSLSLSHSRPSRAAELW